MAKRFVLLGNRLDEGHRVYGLHLEVDEDGDLELVFEDHRLSLEPEQFEQLISLVKLEDVPEPKSPGQRLWDEVYPNSGKSWAMLDAGTKSRYEQKAEALGIQPL